MHAETFGQEFTRTLAEWNVWLKRADYVWLFTLWLYWGACLEAFICGPFAARLEPVVDACESACRRFDLPASPTRLVETERVMIGCLWTCMKVFSLPCILMQCLCSCCCWLLLVGLVN
jgi:hypothetical protein